MGWTKTGVGIGSMRIVGAAALLTAFGCNELEAMDIGSGTVGPADLHCGCIDGSFAPGSTCRFTDLASASVVYPEQQSVGDQPPAVLSQVGRIATGLTVPETGRYEYDLREAEETGTSSQFAVYTYLVDDAGDVFRRVRSGTRSTETGAELEVTTSDVERLAPEVIDALAGTCASVYAHERFECVHDIVSTAEAAGSCGLDIDGEPL